jgi:uncharacterized ion transporter superfamily protein YfcC
MNEKVLSENKRKYNIARHHSWAGTVILSVVLAVRIIIPDIHNIILYFVVSALVIYILCSLSFTYKYRSGLSSQEKSISVDASVEIEKERLKLEKKRTKAEEKSMKKQVKK